MSQTAVLQQETTQVVLVATPVVAQAAQAAQAAQELVLVVAQQAVSEAQAEYRPQSVVLPETDRTVVHSVLLQLTRV